MGLPRTPLNFALGRALILSWYGYGCYALAVLAPLLALRFARQYSFLRLWVSVVVMVSTLAVLPVVIFNIGAQMELTRYDVNGDGIYSHHEQTPGQKAAMDRVIGDGGRNVFALALLIVGVIWTVSVASLSAVARALWLRRRRRT